MDVVAVAGKVKGSESAALSATIFLRETLDQLGLPDFILSTVPAFPRGRKQQVKIGQHVGDWLPVHKGVQQAWGLVSRG